MGAWRPAVLSVRLAGPHTAGVLEAFAGALRTSVPRGYRGWGRGVLGRINASLIPQRPPHLEWGVLDFLPSQGM